MSESMRPRKHVAEETRSAMCGRLRVGKAAFQIERTKGLCGSPHHDSNYRGRTGCRHSQLRRDLRPPTSLSHGENRGFESLVSANNINALHFEDLLVSRPCPVEILDSRASPR